MRRHRHLQQLSVLDLQRGKVRGPEFLQQASRTLDIGKEEGDGARRERGQFALASVTPHGWPLCNVSRGSFKDRAVRSGQPQRGSQ
jgi:hypothetical protein